MTMIQKNDRRNFVQKMNSTRKWVGHFLGRVGQLEQRFEELAAKRRSNSFGSTRSVLNKPINILVLDGGAMRGAAHIVTLGELRKLPGGKEVLDYFDLMGGTSIGGAVAMLANQCGSKTETYPPLIDTTQQTLKMSQLSLSRLVTQGAASNGYMDVVEHYYADTPLKSEDKIKTFALAGRSSVHECGNISSTVEPFLLRTYDLPSATNGDERKIMTLPGTSDATVSEAIGMTTAAPVLFDRHEKEIDGKVYRIADGGVISNSPVGVAIAEAKELYPDRPIGLILHLSLDDDEAQVNFTEMERARELSPTLRYVRLHSPAIENFGTAETDTARLKAFEEEVAEYVRTSEMVKEALNSLQTEEEIFRGYHVFGSSRSSMVTVAPKRMSMNTLF